MRSLRILHVTPYCAGAWAYGGIPRLSDSLARGLARRGHRVTVCTTDACDATSRLRARDRAADGVDLRVFPNLSNRLAYRFQLFLPLGLERYLRAHAGEFDVAHLHACRNVPGVIAAHFLHRVGVPYVLAPNGTAPRLERRLLAKRIFDAAAGDRVLSQASCVLAVSNAERRQLRTLGVGDRRIRVIPNPIDLAEFTPAISAGRFRARLPEAARAARLVVFLGQLSPRKRLDVLVRAFAACRRRDGWLVIAGADMGALDRTRMLARTLGVADRVVFPGLLRGRERLELLADADVVVYPSQDEIFGLVPLEALLAGAPVVVADDSGCAEVIGRVGGGEIVPLADVAALAAAIAGLLDASHRGRAHTRDAATRIREAFGADEVCSQIEELYGDMLACA